MWHLYYAHEWELKLSHYTPRRRLRGEKVQLLLILGIGTRWAWVVSVKTRPRFSPRESTPGTHWTGGWVGPRADLDTEIRGKILSPLSGIEPRSPGRPARSQTLYWLSYPAHRMAALLRIMNWEVCGTKQSWNICSTFENVHGGTEENDGNVSGQLVSVQRFEWSISRISYCKNAKLWSWCAAVCNEVWWTAH
jgi:hypothetical protein